ncbi:heavy metal sensor histidine kinase [Herbaspirillum sp. SJZ107]|uniref:heavy metal sensor histidine kinase n=1 Tax=Herbaspirillum sp. SJZ107 TaxID=2572881 RepID=UPI00116E7B43|nr:heavy metal sensor histidine kinase [Herbaspirillum sp. SJZ107]TQK07657.1 two-component system heavy metal sensor histidine kinase CusS [Herbaspirillum sp. SJZ107]
MTRTPLSISLRLGVLFAAIAAGVFGVVDAYLYQTLAVQMEERDDADLLNKGLLVRQLLSTLPAGGRMPQEQLQAVLAPVIGQEGVSLHVALPDGQVLVSTVQDEGRLSAYVPVPLTRAPERLDIVEVEGEQSPTHVLDMLADYGGLGARTQVRVLLLRERSDRLAILQRYRIDLLTALGAGILLASALGFWAIRSGLRPLRGMVAKANDIHTHHLNTRLDPASMPAELREMAVAFNDMLDRLEEGVQRLSGFAADLAHDLRTPINALMMQTQVALGQERSIDEYQALLASTQEEYERLSRMIENTLFLARAENAQLAMRRERLDIKRELAHIADYFEMLAEEKNVQLTLGPMPSQPLFADPVLLRRAVNNLMSNAITYTPPGGRVRLEARAEESWITISVSNSGDGVPSFDLERVFDRYYQADPARASGSSVGLGLPIVRVIMHLHGGGAQAEIHPGADTVFSLCFPRQVPET